MNYGKSLLLTSISNNYEFYDNYTSDVDLFNLGQFANSAGSSEDPNARDDLTHGVKLYDCYPTNIGSPSYHMIIIML